MYAMLLARVLLAATVVAAVAAGAANAPAAAGATTLQANSGAAETPRHWAADTSNGCKIWSPGALNRDVTVRWSGRCENDLAQGPGTVRWLNSNKQVSELTGNMEQGKMRGHTTGVEEPGNRFDGMFIDSLPEGEGRVTFADGSVYSGQWHRGHQLGYGIMTFPPAHPQYQEMLSEGKGRRAENGIYVLRGWWEGKTFVLPCDSEDECEKAVVVMMKREQAAAAAKAGVAAPEPTVVPAVEPAIPATPAPAVPAVEPAATPPVVPAMEPTAPPASPPPATPATEPAPATPPPGAPDIRPLPAATAPIPEPAMEPAPADAPVPVPETTTPATSDAGFGVPLTINGFS
ncbi:MAG: Large tegument protein [Collimonas fungivorans]|uniref:hypothetical protein n=1 Tax=Collimonas fungivorans TaxID=158899 RepID=UPI0026ED7750|nr:hypothetical protein [Collimonas fungivorans]MDB5766415.1 Large tegument protein [Collimonas fungivorans]